MKLTVLFLSATISATSYAGGNHCSQKTYDNIYKSIIGKALNSKLTQEDILDKNRSIIVLRQLCYGQLSSWEKGVWK